MNWVDLAVLAIVIVSALIGFLRGLVREALGIAAWVIAAAAASPFGLLPKIQPWVRSQILDPTIADAVAFGSVFLVVLVILLLIVGWISRGVRGSVLGGLDRSLGLVFGGARGAFLIVVSYIVVGLVLPVENWPAPVKEARALPVVFRGAELVRNKLPEGYQPKIDIPNFGRAATAADLLRATPAGRALSGSSGQTLGSRTGRE